MTTIALRKNVYSWLAAAMSPDKLRPHLRHVIVTDDKKIVTTDGYRMHVYPVEEQHEPGYYTYDKAAERLMSANNEDVGYTLYDSQKNNFQSFYAMAQEPAARIVSANGTKLLVGIDWPKLTKWGHWTMFKRATLDETGKELRAVCLGIGGAPWVFYASGTLGLSFRRDFFVMDALFLQDALAYGMVPPLMRWTTSTRPCMIGELDSMHAIIMPGGGDDRWELDGDFNAMRERCEMPPAPWEIVMVPAEADKEPA